MKQRSIGLGATLLFGATLLLSCGEPPTPVDAPDPAASASAPPAKPEPTRPASTVEGRRARWAARPVVELPPAVPPAWRTVASRLDGRLVEARHAVRSRRSLTPWRTVKLVVRVFGDDAEVVERVRAALGAAKLGGLPTTGLPDEPVASGDTTWSVDIGRLVAPPGEPREQIVTIEWRRRPADPAEVKGCRKPPEVEPPAAAPSWLAKVTRARSTRRRVTAATVADRKGTAVALRMLFHNGNAHDEHVGHLAEAAARAGFTHVSGEGPRQRWTHADGRRFEFEPDNSDDLGLGCRLAGPVIAIDYRVPPARSAAKAR